MASEKGSSVERAASSADWPSPSADLASSAAEVVVVVVVVGDAVAVVLTSHPEEVSSDPADRLDASFDLVPAHWLMQVTLAHGVVSLSYLANSTDFERLQPSPVVGLHPLPVVDLQPVPVVEPSSSVAAVAAAAVAAAAVAAADSGAAAAVAAAAAAAAEEEEEEEMTSFYLFPDPS